jgi:hypothetical protein
VFVQLAQPARVVDQEGLAAGLLEDPGRVQVGDVDRRILAHEHRVEGLEGDRGARLDREGLARGVGAAHPRELSGGDRIVVLEAEVIDLTGPHLVLAIAGLDHERVGRVAGEGESVERVDDEQEPHAHTVAEKRRPHRHAPAYHPGPVARG